MTPNYTWKRNVANQAQGGLAFARTRAEAFLDVRTETTFQTIFRGDVMVVRPPRHFAGTAVAPVAASTCDALAGHAHARAVAFDLAACESVDSVALRAAASLPDPLEVLLAGARGVVSVQLALLSIPARLRVEPNVAAALDGLRRRGVRIEDPPVPAAAPAPADRRRSERFPLRTAAWLRAPGGEESGRIAAVDVSAHGLGLTWPLPSSLAAALAPDSLAHGAEVEVRVNRVFGRNWVRARLVRHDGAPTIGLDLSASGALAVERLARAIARASVS